jgi:hypothetical protein
MGKKQEVIPCYETTIRLGLTDRWLAEPCSVWASSLRTIGHFIEALKVLDEGMRRFPDHRALQVFHALTLFSLE